MKKTEASLLTAVFLLCILVSTVIKDKIIIEIGIVAYRGIRIALFAILVLLVILNLISVVKLVAKGRRNRQKELHRKDMLEKEREQAEKSQAKLSVKDRLKNHELRQILTSLTSGKWTMAEDKITICINDLNLMDTYQEKLHKLLETNDAVALSDTEDMLDSVEQYICRNARKVINYMSVADSNDPESLRKVKEKFDLCNKDNKEQLDRVQEFLFVLTDYLNQQGDDADTDMLDVYKTTILNAINAESASK